MAKYKVIIRSLVTKTIEVEASDETKAEEQASELFTTDRDAFEERYEQETISIDEAVLWAGFKGENKCL